MLFRSRSEFTAPAQNSLRYAERQGNVWSIADIPAAGTQAGGPSLALAPDGSPLIAYYSNDVLQLRVATRSAGTWSVQTVDAQGNTGQYSATAFGPSGAAYIAYKADQSLGLRLARSEGLTAVLTDVAPSRLRIQACAPNPARAGAAVSLAIESPLAEQASIEAFDVSGRRLGATLVRTLARGTTRVAWTPPAASGICFVRVRGEGGQAAVARLAVLP